MRRAVPGSLALGIMKSVRSEWSFRNSSPAWVWAVTTERADGWCSRHPGETCAPQFELSLAKERIAAAAEAVRSLPFPFILTARAENFLVGRPCLDDTLKRLEAFSDAGADVLYAPALPDERALSAILAVAGGKPINMLATASGIGSDLEQLSSLGVRRVSLGSALTRLAFTAIRSAIAEVREGSLGFLPGAIPLEKTNELFS
jgi:2-methylisocitrate lyase-like PEP mutase family enzyme